MGGASTEKKYVCTHQGCNKTFNRRDYLDRHSTNHLQVKPYTCKECERQFSRKDLYENHLTTRFHARRAQAGHTHGHTHPSPAPDSPEIKAEDTATPMPPASADGFFNDGPIQFSLDMASNSNSSGVGAAASSMLGPSLGSDFGDGATAVNYNALPGFESERWEFYRPFKRVPELSYDSLPKRLKYGSLLSEGGSEGTSLGSEVTTSNRTFETEFSGSSGYSLSPGVSAPTPGPGHAQGRQGQAPTPAAYKMWLIDRFKGGDDADTSSLREPCGEDPEFTRKYTWFFDNSFTTANGKFGYDRMYSQSVRASSDRAKRYHTANYPEGVPETPLPTLSEERGKLLLQILASGTQSVLGSAEDIDRFIADSWKRAHVIPCIVHRPTFNPNTAHPALLAVMTIVGMAFSSCANTRELARAAAPNVSLYVYESLNQPEGPTSTRYTLAYVGHFVAFCLLLKYEPLILGRDLYNSSLIRASSCRRSADKFLAKLICCVSQLGLVPKSPVFACQRKPVWASISEEGYAFHQGADRDLQWREWAAYEVCKRTVHFTIYSDSVISMCDNEPSFAAVSLFNMDIHMVCPEAIWQAQDPTEFFYIVGPSTVLSNLPYLGILKSLVRFPRGLPSGIASTPRGGSSEERTPLSLMALRIIAHGLMNIVSRLSGVATRGDAVMQAVLANSPQPLDMQLQLSPFFDVSVQARLYRGLDIWFQHFEESYGKVTDRLFEVSDAIGLKITDEMLEDIDEEGEEKAVPQYALYLVLYHYSSFIIVHEDLPIVLQFTTNLAKWLKSPNEQEEASQQALVDFLYMPLYTQWIQSDEAKAMVSTAAMYLVWVDAASGQVTSKTWKHLFLSAVIYTSVLVVVLYDLVVHHASNNGDMATYSAGRVSLSNYDFMEQSIKYLQSMSSHPNGQQHGPDTPPVISVLLAGACMLYMRPYTQELYTRLEQLICVLDPQLTPDRVRLVLEGASDMFQSRQNTILSR